MKKIVVLISGNGSNLEAIARACQNNSIPGAIELVISNHPGVKGLERAQKYHLMTQTISHADFPSREDFDQALVEQVLSIEPDLVVLAGFMRILTTTFTDAFAGKLINIHPSLLPEYPGLNTHRQALDNGDLMHGVTVHFVDGGLDNGPIIAQGALKIDPSQTEAKLIQRIHKIEHALFPKVIAELLKGLICLKDEVVHFETDSHFGKNKMEFFNV
jgi:phosphoribosylglycinamide formyltransferase-1|tara:strand:+ start:3294 stop:3941 length:648 start_codon:yes stop_codon:yes gene_type:complete